MSTTARKPFAERCSAEATRDAIFLFQRRRYIYTALPKRFKVDEGYVTETHDREGVKLRRPKSYTAERLMKEGVCTMVNGWEVPAVMETWDTEGVFLSREEATDYGKRRAYNYRDGWRVYSVCAEGDLAELIKST